MNVKKIKNKDTNIERRDRKRSGLRFCSQRSQLDSRQLIKIISRATRRLYEQHSVYMYIYIPAIVRSIVNFCKLLAVRHQRASS